MAANIVTHSELERLEKNMSSWTHAEKRGLLRSYEQAVELLRECKLLEYSSELGMEINEFLDALDGGVK